MSIFPLDKSDFVIYDTFNDSTLEQGRMMVIQLSSVNRSALRIDCYAQDTHTVRRVWSGGWDQRWKFACRTVKR